MANANLFGSLANPPSRAGYLADCNLYVVKDRSQKQISSIVSFMLCKLNYSLVMEVSHAFLCLTVFTQVHNNRLPQS